MAGNRTCALLLVLLLLLVRSAASFAIDMSASNEDGDDVVQSSILKLAAAVAALDPQSKLARDLGSFVPPADGWRYSLAEAGEEDGDTELRIVSLAGDADWRGTAAEWEQRFRLAALEEEESWREDTESSGAGAAGVEAASLRGTH